ncbi:MAG: hypothetical protein AVO35_07475 [Candidatus Aegiribacteria sp. MLS_C]|nr:MAG: hypothetical protein AVO35_07475 [Candidatus Aegiribacteria sp. MLS_C]
MRDGSGPADDLRMQRRYFQARLERFGRRPELHRALIADCHSYLEMLEEAGSPGDFMRMVRQSGNMLSMAKAEVSDRYRNRAAVYRALGQERKQAEDMRRLELIGSAGTHAELYAVLEEFEGEASAGFEEDRAMNALGPMMEALFSLCTDPPGSGSEELSLSTFREYWRQMREADPGVTWERISGCDAYRDRLIFDDRQMGILEKRFREVVNG